MNNSMLITLKRLYVCDFSAFPSCLSWSSGSNTVPRWVAFMPAKKEKKHRVAIFLRKEVAIIKEK